MRTKRVACLLVCVSGVWLVFTAAVAACTGPPDCGSCRYWDGDSCELIGTCAPGAGCPSCHSCVDCYCCSDAGCGCSYGGDCCSGGCNSYTHKCKECIGDWQCGECEACFSGSCGSILPCPAGTHCDNHTCVSDCVEDGPYCTYTTPPISPACGHPVNNYACIVAGNVCAWQDLGTLHANARCIIPGCTTVSRPCTTIRPWLCYNGPCWWCIPYFVICTCDDTQVGSSYPAGTWIACP
jgi:hypothetical protein